jgi:uncharacterized protein
MSRAPSASRAASVSGTAIVSRAASVLSGAVRVYELTLRPLIGANCRFHPSCSAYAREAFATHGARRGAALAARRILRCHPWNEGGLDPVPTVLPAPFPDPKHR